MLLNCSSPRGGTTARTTGRRLSRLDLVCRVSADLGPDSRRGAARPARSGREAGSSTMIDGIGIGVVERRERSCANPGSATMSKATEIKSVRMGHLAFNR